MLEALLVIILGTVGLLTLAGLIGFLVITGAMYLTHRPVVFSANEKRSVLLPPPIQPETPTGEIVLHPLVEQYINGESEPWYREQLRELAKSLYKSRGSWEWVLTELTRRNEEQSMTLPDAFDDLPVRPEASQPGPPAARLVPAPEGLLDDTLLEPGLVTLTPESPREIFLE